MLVHVDTTHLLVNGLSLLAFGGAVAQRIGNGRFLAFLVMTGVAGALAYIGLNWGRMAIVVGASGAVSGMMAASFRFFFAALGTVGLQGFRDNPRAVPLLSVAETFRNRQCLIAMVVWALINFAMGLGGSFITGGAGIAWEAHLGGFLAGLLLFGYFDPPYEPPADDFADTAEAAEGDSRHPP
jgi:membrane associated rhomboid family serine protease